MVQNNQLQPAPARRTPWPALILGLLILGGAGYFFYNATRPRPAAVERRDIVGYVPLKGEIVTPPSAYADVHAAYSAAVDKVYTTLGAYVKRGDVLVSLANPSATESYEQARQNVRVAETAYANAQKQYDANISAYRKQLAAVKSGQATTVTTDSSSDNTTVTTTASGDAASAEAALQQAQADRASGLAAYQQQLDAARVAYREARAGKRMSQVRAPISGTVIALNAQPGQTVGQNGAPVATVVDLSALQVQAGMTPAQAGAVKTQQPVVLTFDNVPNKQFEGTIKRITTQADPNSSTGVVKGAQYIALVSFKNTDGLVKPNETANVSVKTGEVKNALAVPVEAVHPDSTGKPTLKVLENGQWRAVAVQTGMTDGRYIQIKTGVKEGETVQSASSLVQASAITK